MFQVFLGRKARQTFERGDARIKRKMRAVFETLELNPWPAREYDLAKLQGLKDCFRIRLGKYRICYTVDEAAEEITVYRIERRSESTYR